MNGKSNGRDSGKAGGGQGRRGRLPGLAWTALALVVLLALVNAYGRTLAAFVEDTWGPDFAYFDNGRLVQVKLHELPRPGRPPAQAPGGAGWPEKVLRPACYYTLSLMGLSGPEGGLWRAALEGKPPAQTLVVRATADGSVVGRYRVTEGSEEAGLAVVELDAGPNGLHLMDMQEPVPGVGWYVVQLYYQVGR